MLRLATLIALLIAASSPLTVHPAAALHLPTEVAGGEAPRTDGQTVVWTDDGYFGYVYAMRLDDREIMQIAVDAESSQYPLAGSFADVDGDLVVWVEHGRGFPSLDPRLVVTNIRTGDRFVITPSAGFIEPRISGSMVVWSAGNAIMARDLSTPGEPFRMIEVPEDGSTVSELSQVDIDGNHVVWYERVSSCDGERVHWRYMALQLGGEPFVLAEGDESQWPIGGIDINGNLAVYAVRSTIYVADLSSGATREFVVGEWIGGPTTDGRYVFWSDRSLANLYEIRSDIRGYDLATDSSFAVVFNVGYNVDLEARDGVLVWQRGNTTKAVHVMSVHDALPSARRPDPGQSSSQWFFFSETGHYLWGMRPFWESNGGLPVFGYPMTEEFLELNADSGKVHNVQYFERQRFEHHPENAGTPYEVLLGRLGVEQLASEGRDWEVFAKASPSAAHYFPETRFAISDEFWGYWSGRGLDLGDQGVSTRESIALFGYPISPAMIETNADGHLVLTQFFERAVFEHHPSNDLPFSVLLRRLGVEVIEERGW